MGWPVSLRDPPVACLPGARIYRPVAPYLLPLFISVCVFVHMCICAVDVHAEVGGQFAVARSLLHHVAPGDQTQVIRFYRPPAGLTSIDCFPLFNVDIGN